MLGLVIVYAVLYTVYKMIPYTKSGVKTFLKVLMISSLLIIYVCVIFKGDFIFSFEMTIFLMLIVLKSIW